MRLTLRKGDTKLARRLVDSIQWIGAKGATTSMQTGVPSQRDTILVKVLAHAVKIQRERDDVFFFFMKKRMI